MGMKAKEEEEENMAESIDHLVTWPGPWASCINGTHIPLNISVNFSLQQFYIITEAKINAFEYPFCEEYVYRLF